MDLTTSADGVVLSLSGELDLASAPLLHERLLEASQSGPGDVVCDLTDVTFMDSTGLSVLLSAQKRMQHAGGAVILLNPSTPVTRIMEITAVDSYFTIRQG